MTKAQLAFSLIAALWAGEMLGVSFIATPAKFLAPSLLLPVALDVGRATFRIALLVEMGLGLALVATGIAASGFGAGTLAAVALLLVLIAQRMLLLPILDERAALVMAGAHLRTSWHHQVWIAADALRFFGLLGLCIAAFRQIDPS